MEEKWYKAVTAACALDQDYEQLPCGNTSQIGTKGLSLSGGHKQRVSPACALYSRKPVVVIDDVLNGLDW
ncbi:hypothetical protein EsDP_00005656 [Epichloe bromicola]|uniref:ABC transporter domain-containing protein n=1 Tax=Epichloe bromicola TaxID=79588 RepID=A0ABQ0CVC5_9HYPO